MKPPRRYYEGAELSATEFNRDARNIRSGRIIPGAGLIGSSTARGTPISVTKQTSLRKVPTVGGALVVTVPMNYADTPLQVALEPTLTDEILGVPSEGMAAAGGMLDIDAATPDVTMKEPGRYLIHVHATCGYSAACAQAKNLSDCVTRLRFKIGGVWAEETAIYGTHHSKLCASGLVHEVTNGDLAVEDDGYGTDVLTGSVAVSKVTSYNRWTGGRITIHGTFQLMVVLDADGEAKIATELPASEGDLPTMVAPTLGLWIDRYAIEPDPVITPLEWLDPASTTLTLHSAQLHITRLS